MKKILGYLLLTVTFVTTTAVSTSSPEAMHSIEGTWELQSFYNYDGENIMDTTQLVEGYRQVKMYYNGNVMWSRTDPNDTIGRFGYGTYEITQDELIEVIEYGDHYMMQALDTIRQSLKSNNARRKEVAIAALSNWPNHEVASDLKAIAQSTKNNSQKIRVLRALARVAVLGGDDQTRLDFLKYVMSAATRADEKMLAIDRAKAIRTVESLNFVLPHIEDDELGPRARRTVIDLAHHRGLREPNRDAFEPALKRVIPLLQDARQIERAKKYLANE